MERELTDNKIYLRSIYIISLLIPVVVAFLIWFPTKIPITGKWIYSLPGIHAGINSITVFTLIGALVCIKRGAIKWHKNFMFVSLFLGILFLISYVLYHSSVESVKFGDLNHDGILSEMELVSVGSKRTVYLLILASHIILSILVVPFVLLAFYYSLTDQIGKHKRLVRFTFPIWMYVSVTGVIVYLLIRPFYF